MANPFRRQCRPALGTFVEVALHEDDLPANARDQQAVFDAAFSRIGQVQRQMSFHDPCSDLSRLNLAQPGTTLHVLDWTYEVLAIAMQVFEATGGLFDAGVGKKMVREGLLPDHAVHLQQTEDADGLSSLANWRLNEKNSITVLRRACIDLGGIAKGFAVDKAVEAITAMQVARCLVNAGGDLKLVGDISENIFVRQPDAPGTLILLGAISDGAVATSAPYFSLQGEGGNQRCALFSPDGESLTQSHSYTVLAQHCVIADALTKAVAGAFIQDLAGRDTKKDRTDGPAPFHAGFLERFEAQAFIF